MRFGTLCEIVSAIHLSQFVEGPYNQRGGLWFVAPAGHLKTTAVEIVEDYERSILISNLTVKSLNAMRGDFMGGTIKTLGVADLEQIYRRHSSVSSQIEGILMSLVEEGYRNPGFADQRIQAPAARCVVIGGMTTTFFEKMQESWLDCGFYRRFLWSRYQLEDSSILTDAIADWRKAELDGDFFFKTPRTRSINFNLDEKEVGKIRHSLRFQRDCKTPFVLALKICCVLKWKFGKTSKAMNIWDDFSESLGKNNAHLIVTDRGRKNGNGNHG